MLVTALSTKCSAPVEVPLLLHHLGFTPAHRKQRACSSLQCNANGLHKQIAKINTSGIYAVEKGKENIPLAVSFLLNID